METKFNAFDSQVALYAKGWYKETDIIEDLKIILGKICLLETKFISDTDLLQQTAQTLHKCLAIKTLDSDLDTLYKEIWRDWKLGMFAYKTSLTVKDLVESHLSVLRMRNVELCPPMPTPDPNYLPLSCEEALARWEEFNKV
jgi:hypothetical protein